MLQRRQTASYLKAWVRSQAAGWVGLIRELGSARDLRHMANRAVGFMKASGCFTFLSRQKVNILSSIILSSHCCYIRATGGLKPGLSLQVYLYLLTVVRPEILSHRAHSPTTDSAMKCPLDSLSQLIKSK